MLNTLLLKRYDTIIVGFSGGLDSTVLLHLVCQTEELRGKVRAVHVHHGLSPFASIWQKHCEDLCRAWNIPLSVHRVTVLPVNTEEDARIKRYEVFASELPPHGCLLLGHHEDDVAETVMLNMMRGSGLKGLTGIPCEQPFHQGMLFRPLLTYDREAIKRYARQHALHWIEDESNENRHYARNYLRHEVLPTLQQRWPRANHKIVECARHLHAAQQNLYDLAEIDCPDLKQVNSKLNFESLTHLNEHRLTNIVMTWLHRLHVKIPHAVTCRRIIHEVIWAAQDKTPLVSWDTYKIRRYEKCLYLSVGPDELNTPQLWENFPRPLVLNREEILIASPSSFGVYVPPDALVEVRYRVGGETIRLNQSTHHLKKLFQERRILPWLRGAIPLIFVNNELVCAVDFLTRDPYDDAKPLHTYQIQRRPKNETV